MLENHQTPSKYASNASEYASNMLHLCFKCFNNICSNNCKASNKVELLQTIMLSEYCMNHFIFLNLGMPSFCLAALSSLSSLLSLLQKTTAAIILSGCILQKIYMAFIVFTDFIGLQLALLPAAPMPIFFRFMPSKSFTPSLHVAAYCCSSAILSMV